MHYTRKKQYLINLVRVIDGDTILADITMGFNIILKNKSIRLYGNDAHELYSKNHFLADAAKTFLRNLLITNQLMIEVEEKETDKYGRILATVYKYTSTEEWININELMLKNNHSTPAIIVSGKYIKKKNT